MELILYLTLSLGGVNGTPCLETNIVFLLFLICYYLITNIMSGADSYKRGANVHT